MPNSDGTPNSTVSGAARSHVYRVQKQEIASLKADLFSTERRVAALESDLESAQAELLSLRARVASQQDLESAMAQHRAVASAALALVAALAGGVSGSSTYR